MQVSSKSVVYLKFAPIIEESTAVHFPSVCMENPFSHYLHNQSELRRLLFVSFCFLANRKVEHPWLRNQFGLRSALWDTKKFRYLETLFWQLFLAFILQHNY